MLNTWLELLLAGATLISWIRHTWLNIDGLARVIIGEPFLTLLDQRHEIHYLTVFQWNGHQLAAGTSSRLNEGGVSLPESETLT